MTFHLHKFTSTASSKELSPTTMINIPPEPTSMTETGLGMGFLTDLVLKIVYFQGNITGHQLAEVTKLPFLGVIDKILEFLKLEEFVDIIGTQGGFSERSFQYVIALKGRAKVGEILDRSQYAGPAPVTLDIYIDMVKQQSVGTMVIDTKAVREAFAHIVVNEQMLDRIGPAANSARSLFLYGPPGNGKTTIAEGIANMLGGYIILPYAIEVDGQIIKLYDPLNHKIVAMPAAPEPAPSSPFGGIAS